MVSKAISLIEDEELFFLFIFKGVHTFVELFQLNDTDKLAFYKNNAAAFKAEFNIAKPTKMSLDKKYRGLRKTLELFLSDEEVEDKEYQILWDILKERNEGIEKVVHLLLKHHKESTLEIPLEHLLSSYVHMSVNRSFRHKQRFYEMVGYDFLERYTRSMLKRNSSR